MGDIYSDAGGNRQGKIGSSKAPLFVRHVSRIRSAALQFTMATVVKKGA